ncbi:MAG: acylase [Imperialibacter sp.]|uniref:acylase n=1 Tax=Imperialibacter sp. TaxID=2038411 RepID=UPI0032EEF8E4
MRRPIKLILVLVSIFIFQSCETPQQATAEFTADEIQRWEATASRVTIIRDNWGIPHIYGKTDADAIFGMLYAQCEDDFKRIETNYLTSIGRMAEVEGEKALYTDLRQRLFINEEEIKALYNEAPEGMKEQMKGFADGINYYLYKHPEVKPMLLTRFEPWMPLTFSEGSIGGDIESISTENLEAFYGGKPVSPVSSVYTYEPEPEPTGSNGFAIAPSNSASGNSLLLINPHTSFFFRSEQHVVSEEGLNAYGAVTWGQYFIYQGFNEHCGWMHTSSAADVIDEFAETVVEKDGNYFYKYGEEERALEASEVTLKYKDGEKIASKTFTTYKSHHGPIVREEDGKWIAVGLMQDPLNALSQSYMRTKAATYNDFNNNMRLRTNSSNNTVYADDQGNIGYYHGNFMPVRDPRFDYSGVIDGSNPATDWQGLHKIEELVSLLNPESGWLQNCNSTPFTAAAGFSPKPEHYPVYMAPDQENARGIHAVRVLEGKTNFTLDNLIEAAYDPYLVGFENLVPSVVQAYEGSSEKDADLAAPIKVLKEWDLRFGEESIGTALAIFWAQELMKDLYETKDVRLRQLAMIDYMTTEAEPQMKLEALRKAVEKLTADFGTWETAWGQINRFQRVEGAIREPFNDELASNPIAYTSSMWGALSAFGSRPYTGTKRWYGTSGNSFVAVVEFGDTVKAKAIVTGGQKSDPASSHFNDQAEMYRKGEFRDVLFYRADIEAVAEKTYKPGE